MKNPRHGLQAMSVFSGLNLLSWGSHVFPLQSELLTPRCLPHREDLSLHYASPPNSFWVITQQRSQGVLLTTRAPFPGHLSCSSLGA